MTVSTDLRQAPPGVAARLSPEAERRLDVVVCTVHEISSQTDPQELVRMYRRRVDQLFDAGGSVSLSRRDLDAPFYRVTRSTSWTQDIDPWLHPHRLPLLSGGLLGGLLYAGEPRVLHDVTVPPDDPAGDHLAGVRSVLCLPLYDAGAALNMVVRTSPRPDHFSADDLPDLLLQANLFGKAVNGLVLSRKLQQAYSELDREMKRVGQIQQALLPPTLPDIPGADLAASYKTAARAGGDYYDFFSLAEGRWGIMMADVSGHGPPAAVIMAMLRTMLHTQCTQCMAPGEVLRVLNRALIEQPNLDIGLFVTAFYAIYDPGDRSMLYACAGHNPPLVVDRAQNVRELDEAQALPLAVDADTDYREARTALSPGDTLILYTDGITEARNRTGELYGTDRLFTCVRENIRFAQEIVDCINGKLAAFTEGRPILDDQTLVAMLVK